MKTSFLTLSFLLGFALPGLSATVPFPEVPAALQQAKEQGKPALILWYGSDWVPQVDKLCNDWKALSSSGMPVVLGQFDEKTGLDGEVRKKTLPLERYNIPTAVLLAPDGSFMATFPPEVTRDTATLKRQVLSIIPSAPEFMKLSAKARSSSGVAAATAAGQALDLLRVSDALHCNDLRKIINKQDPNDTTGYRSLYGMEHLDMYGEMDIILKGGPDGKLKGKDRDFDAAEAFMRKALKNGKLKGERRQQWLAGLYYVQRLKMENSAKKDRSAMLATLKQIVDVDPNSEYGKGAAKFYHYWDPASVHVITRGYFDTGEQTLGFEKDWHVDVSSSVTTPGTYLFSLKQMDGGKLISRNYRLAVNGKVVSTPSIDPKTDTKVVELTVPEGTPANAKIEVWLTAECRDGWMGCCGFIEMKKK
ncbi:MAG: hypothetical protein IJB31_07745 [Akkermansia sp.]|nr:hypothetical protein [Akkermansia sp.]